MTAFSHQEDAALVEAADPAVVEVADEQREDEAAVNLPEVSIWQRLRALVSGADPQAVDELTRAIMQRPEVPANYALRGEMYLSLGQYALAVEDFETALRLAAAQFEEAEWGLVAQVLRDQAQRGLERARQRLARQQGRTDDGDTG
jgi:Tfp pilus assembly protein PilF